MKDAPEQGHSVTWLLGKIQLGDSEALAALWQRYFQRLLQVARSRLASQPDRIVDEEDVVLSVFDRLFQGASQGRFPKLNDRSDLWQILVMLTERSVIDQHRRNKAEKRGGSPPIPQSDLVPTDLRQIQELVDSSPSPEVVAALNENLSRAMNRLGQKTRNVALLKLEGYTNKEIGQRLGVSISTVERKIRMIRETWEAQYLEDSPSAFT